MIAVSHRSRTILRVSFLVLLVAGCAERRLRIPRPSPDDAGTADASSLDLSAGDLGALPDLGVTDLGAAADLGRDLGGSADLGLTDLGASVDLGRDLGASTDLGVTDLGPTDLGPRDLGAADLGRDAGPISGVTVSFPSVGDTWTRAGEHLWEAGTSVQGVRSVALATVGRVSIAATLEANALTCDGQDMRLVVDGRVAGTFTISGGDTVVNRDFTFVSGPVSGGVVTLRYENAREVASGCGSARFDKTLSTLTLAP